MPEPILSADERRALEQILRAADTEFKATERWGYYANGWGYRQLQGLLDRTASMTDPMTSPSQEVKPLTTEERGRAVAYARSVLADPSANAGDAVIAADTLRFEAMLSELESRVSPVVAPAEVVWQAFRAGYLEALAQHQGTMPLSHEAGISYAEGFAAEYCDARKDQWSAPAPEEAMETPSCFFQTSDGDRVWCVRCKGWKDTEGEDNPCPEDVPEGGCPIQQDDESLWKPVTIADAHEAIEAMRQEYRELDDSLASRSSGEDQTAAATEVSMLRELAAQAKDWQERDCLPSHRVNDSIRAYAKTFPGQLHAAMIAIGERAPQPAGK